MHAAIRELYNLDCDNGDPWGSCMSHWFAVAGTLHRHGGNIPESWQYRPGLFADEGLEDWPETEYEDMLTRDEITLADVKQAGLVFDRFARRLKHAAMDY